MLAIGYDKLKGETFWIGHVGESLPKDIVE
jgi:hypothetical protein